MITMTTAECVKP